MEITAVQAIGFFLQLVALFPTLEPAFVKAVKDFEALFNSGTATQEDLDNLIAQAQAQSAIIAKL